MSLYRIWALDCAANKGTVLQQTSDSFSYTLNQKYQKSISLNNNKKFKSWHSRIPMYRFTVAYI